MAHFLLTAERDPLLRAEVSKRALRRFSHMPGLQVETRSFDDCLLVWACRSHIPRDSTHRDAACSLLLGYALDDHGRWLSAGDYLREWSSLDLVPTGHDGYFVGVRYDRQRGLIVEVDPWGLFPLYYSHVGSTLLVGSSADFFHCHPHFVERVDLSGLAGILLTNGLVGEQTLLMNVVRLTAGCSLFRTPFGSTQEIETFAPETPLPPAGWSEQEIADESLRLLRQACARHAPSSGQTTVMLSGGLDSRLMAACVRDFDANLSATTLGLPTDFEALAAERVAASLQMPWLLQSDSDIPPDLEARVKALAREQHLSGGFSNLDFAIHDWGFGSASSCFWSGFFVDDLLGGCGSWFGFDPEAGEWSSDRFLAKLQRWGMSAESCGTLLNFSARDADAVAHDCEQRFHSDWARLPGEPAQRSLLCKIRTRIRGHIGSAVHRLSFWSWPLIPALDRRFVEFMLRVPAGATRDGRLETRMLEMMFPRLARVPLDANSFHFSPIHSGFLRLLPRVARLVTSCRKRWNSVYWTAWRQTEPRRYFRTYDLNGSLWRDVRWIAEQYRDQLDPWLMPAEVARLVPPPDCDIRVKNRFSDGACVRTLLGLMLWSAGERVNTMPAA
jgi:asparagine synthase (glutamine-hydrolysing)